MIALECVACEHMKYNDSNDAVIITGSEAAQLKLSVWRMLDEESKLKVIDEWMLEHVLLYVSELVLRVGHTCSWLTARLIY